MNGHTTDESMQNTDVDRNAIGAETSNVVEITAQEREGVKSWARKIKVAREFDEGIRELYAHDRKYARAESSGKVNYSLIQAYIDILVAFLAARNPDFDAIPADTVDDSTEQDAEDYGKTMEIVVSHLLKKAKMKRVSERVVRSALSVGIGWFKVTWQEQWSTSPQAEHQKRTLEANLARIQKIREEIAEGDERCKPLDQQMEELRVAIAGAQAQMEVLEYHGICAAMIPPEDMTVCIEADNVLDVENDGWMSQRYFEHIEIAKTKFTRIPEDAWNGATRYGPKSAPKREQRKERKVSGAVAEYSSDDADRFVKTAKNNNFVCCHEVWDADSGTWHTQIEGINAYATEPAAPNAITERFFPFFGLSFTEVDGERHPQSLTQRSAPIQDEIDRCMNALIEHRRRVKPKIGFDGSKVTSDTVQRLNNGVTQEFVNVKARGSDADLRKVFFPITYAAIDAAVYDISQYIRAMEAIWGIQEALTGTVQVAKTATEAEIQQAGTQAKSGYKRDRLESVLAEIGMYVADIAANKLTLQDVQLLCGSQAFWIQVSSPDELRSHIKLDIRAGSSGKPDTAARREAWGVLMPQIKELIMAIANYRQSLPDQVATCLENLLLETGERFGDRVNVKRFIPQAPQSPMVDPVTGVPLTGEQMAAQKAAQAKQQAGAKGGPAPEGQGGQEPPPGEQGAQDRMAPTQTPAAIAG